MRQATAAATSAATSAETYSETYTLCVIPDHVGDEPFVYGYSILKTNVGWDILFREGYGSAPNYSDCCSITHLLGSTYRRANDLAWEQVKQKFPVSA